jgi:two-component system response regulator HydG
MTTPVSEAGSVADACERYSLDEFDLIISDVRLPGDPGTSLIDKAKPTPVLIMTSFGSMKSAVEAMKQGRRGLYLQALRSRRNAADH